MTHTSKGIAYTPKYHITDHLGSTRVFWDGSQAVDRKNYTAFGTVWAGGYATYSRYQFAGYEEQTLLNNKYMDAGARFLGKKLPIWTTMDPLAEKYYSLSPYNYTLGNPVRFIDPNGMDVYRYDDETGEMVLYEETYDVFDQIGRFKYNKKTDTYTLTTNRKGEARTRMDNIEKGILSDGMNFLTSANVWEVGSQGQPTIEGFQDFAIGFGEMIGKEVAGFYYSQQGQNNVSYIHMGSHQDNRYDRSYSSPGIYNVRPDLLGNIQPHTSWHTHPTNAPTADRLRPSGLHDGKGDIGHKNNALRGHPSQRPSYFMILTRGYAPIYY